MKKFEGKPFVILGVNSEATRDRETVSKLSAKFGPPGRSFWDGGTFRSAILNQWNIQYVPTLYLIDHNGNIVSRLASLPDGLELIERKVNAAEAALKK